ncbi:ABC transporter ATP-binding protein [Microbacterium sp. 18062]|uniref:ABC transporter ATP-binding protein n=1 Tax=Microbacterium sp. 18062 TaxID=2681410 RepID=UPI00135B390C|nr:ABC transporter ATP-binding protein [Microbacterium sp. 18062]
MNVLLDVAQLAVRYPGQETDAVSGVSFRLAAGQCVAFVGETGSGKTSSVMASVGLLETADVRAERLQLEGQSLLHSSPLQLRLMRRRALGVVFQDPTASWNPTRRISAQLLETTPRAARAAARERLIALCDRVGITAPGDRVDRYPHQLSGGQLQRFMIAGALLHDPRIMVADEPTSALDASVQLELIALLDELRRERDLGLLLVSHDLHVVARLADTIVVMFRGKVVEQGPAAEVTGSPTHPYTTSLLAASIGMTGPRKVPLATNVAWDPEIVLGSSPVGGS